jgi:hypothetical protein
VTAEAQLGRLRESEEGRQAHQLASLCLGLPGCPWSMLGPVSRAQARQVAGKEGSPSFGGWGGSVAFFLPLPIVTTSSATVPRVEAESPRSWSRILGPPAPSPLPVGGLVSKTMPGLCTEPGRMHCGLRPDHTEEKHGRESTFLGPRPPTGVLTNPTESEALTAAAGQQLA